LLGLDAGDVDGAALLADAARKDPLAAAMIERRRRRGDIASSGAYLPDRAFDRLAGVDEQFAHESISDRPRVDAFRKAVGVDLCDHLIGAALPRLQRQEIVDGAGVAQAHPHRTAMGATLGFGHIDFPAAVAGQMMARLAGTPYAHGESLMILRYRPGEEYRPHHDFLAPGDPDLERRGQRARTALLYLNDGYRGGETHFLQPGIAFPARAGDILVFDNVDDEGAPDISARHAGRPVQSGEKWLASLWFRDRPYRP
jgi:prolyl 4-hydroxylase